MILERIENTPYADIMRRDRFFLPLQMKSASYCPNFQTGWLDALGYVSFRLSVMFDASARGIRTREIQGGTLAIMRLLSQRFHFMPLLLEAKRESVVAQS